MYEWSLLLDKKTSREVGVLGNSCCQRCDAPFYCVAPTGMSLGLGFFGWFFYFCASIANTGGKDNLFFAFSSSRVR